MPQSDENIMVTVKKADGTFKKVPLSDLKKNKEEEKISSNLPIEKQEEPDFDSVPLTRNKEEENEVKKEPQKTVVDRSYIMGYGDKKDEIQNEVKKDTETSKDRFENVESVTEVQKLEPETNAVNIVNEIKPVPVVKTNIVNEPKTESVISKVETPKLLPKQDAKKFVKNTFFTDDLFEKEEKKIEAPKLTAKDFKSPLEENLPEKYSEPGKLAKSTPFNSFVHKPENKQKVINVEKVEKIEPEKTIIKPQVFVQKEKNIDLSSVIKQKTPMHDILTKDKTYGPIEEIQNFSLVDLRRLSTDVGESASRLQQKFLNIKEESIILYLKVLDAWAKSPLYKEYIGKISESISKGVSLEKLLLNNEGISLNEIKSLTIVNKTLEV